MDTNDTAIKTPDYIMFRQQYSELNDKSIAKSKSDLLKELITDPDSKIAIKPDDTDAYDKFSQHKQLIYGLFSGTVRRKVTQELQESLDIYLKKRFEHTTVNYESIYNELMESFSAIKDKKIQGGNKKIKTINYADTFHAMFNAQANADSCMINTARPLELINDSKSIRGVDELINATIDGFFKYITDPSYQKEVLFHVPTLPIAREYYNCLFKLLKRQVIERSEQKAGQLNLDIRKLVCFVNEKVEGISIGMRLKKIHEEEFVFAFQKYKNRIPLTECPFSTQVYMEETIRDISDKLDYLIICFLIILNQKHILVRVLNEPIYLSHHIVCDAGSESYEPGGETKKTKGFYVFIEHNQVRVQKFTQSELLSWLNHSYYKIRSSRNSQPVLCRDVLEIKPEIILESA